MHEFFRPLVSEHLLQADAHLQRVLEAMSAQNYGIAFVVDSNKRLLGTISDGDMRRALLKSSAQLETKKARDLMNAKPKTVVRSELLTAAIQRMEQHKITSLVVIESKKIQAQ